AHRALIGNAFALLRGCAPLTPRYGDIANADVVQPHVHMPPDVGMPMPHVARRNDRARATSDGGTREGGASRPDYATKRENATAAHRALIGNAFALLRGCAPLTPRYGVYCFLYLGVDGLAF
ncbi:hypothetical protein, partial [Halomonas sp. C22]|uniref:hypothetical protein n=1 Tax=Halomonas sp. C22 TaxID=2580567 RepID=UPI001C930D7D